MSVLCYWNRVVVLLHLCVEDQRSFVQQTHVWFAWWALDFSGTLAPKRRLPPSPNGAWSHLSLACSASLLLKIVVAEVVAKEDNQVRDHDVLRINLLDDEDGAGNGGTT